jgi:hypothetical protein
MSKNIQINVALPEDWKKQLERLARIFSVEEEKTLSYQDLIRTAVQEKYELHEQEEIQST